MQCIRHGSLTGTQSSTRLRRHPLRLPRSQAWYERGPPASFWLPGFFFAQSFLTAALQDYARRTGVPVDAVDFTVIPLPPAIGPGAGPGEDSGIDPVENLGQPANPGGSGEGVVVHGLFLEGARWDDEGMCLAESVPKVRAPQVMVMLCFLQASRLSREPQH